MEESPKFLPSSTTFHVAKTLAMRNTQTSTHFPHDLTIAPTLIFFFNISIAAYQFILITLDFVQLNFLISQLAI